MFRQVLDHERHTWLLAAGVKIIDKLSPLGAGPVFMKVADVIKMDAPHPARQAGIINLRVRYDLDWINAHTLLSDIPPFFADDRRAHAIPCHDQNHELHLFERLSDLQPPVA